MKVAYIFSTTGHTVSYKLGKMILPQLEQGIHGVDVVGMFFFDDNTYALRQGDPLGERLAKVAKEQNILLMLCDQCALERGLAELDGAPPVDAASGGLKSPLKTHPKDTVEGVQVGCFPDLYGALAGNPPDHVITL
ncbi:MAG: DsrE family protein [Chloroflexi bacterium]|nr:DsrE family protein [Chloroflexota bacterium]